MIKVGGSVRKALTKSLRETIVPSLKPIIAKDTLEEHLHTIIQTAEEVLLEQNKTFFVWYSLLIWLGLKEKKALILSSNCVGGLTGCITMLMLSAGWVLYSWALTVHDVRVSASSIVGLKLTYFLRLNLVSLRWNTLTSMTSWPFVFISGIKWGRATLR